MTQFIIIEDINGKVYCCRRRDYDQLIRNNPHLKMKLCERVTVHSSRSYIGFWKQLKNNGVLDEV